MVGNRPHQNSGQISSTRWKIILRAFRALPSGCSFWPLSGCEQRLCGRIRRSRIFYVANALLHPFAGNHRRDSPWHLRAPPPRIACGRPRSHRAACPRRWRGFGVYLLFVGMTRPHSLALYVHVGASIAGLFLLLGDFARARPQARAQGERSRAAWRWSAGVAVVRGRVLPRRDDLPAAGSQSAVHHPQSFHCSAEHGAGRRGSGQPGLSQFRANRRWQADQGGVLHELGILQALPHRHLQPMAELDAPHGVVQQPVVSKIDRVHAGHQRHQAFALVRRLPRSRPGVFRHDAESPHPRN